MFVFTAKMTRTKLIVLVLAAAAALCLLIVWVGTLYSSSHNASTETATTKNIKTNEDRVKYLESFGWKVSEDPIDVEEVLIPEQFDDTYAEYNNLQKEQGFDLSKYSGKRVARYTYEIINYPTGETDVRADLLIYKDTVIGGDVLSASLNGFIHGLALPD